MRDYNFDNAGYGNSSIETIIERTLKEHIIDKPDEVDKDECLARAACKIVEALRRELLIPELSHRKRFDIEPPNGRSFNDIAEQILHDVRFSYLSSNLQMMMALGSAIAERDTGSSAHNYKVTLYSVYLGESIGLDHKQIQSLIKGSFLHDIGKIGIPDRILLKESKLSEFEIVTMQNHILLGAHIIKDVKWLEDAVDVVMYHHERWDGRGYLAHLKGEAIPINARIFNIVDVFDALTSDRPYKPAISFENTMKYMGKQSGMHFDPELFSSFEEIAANSYNDLRERDLSELPEMVESAIHRHFKINLADDKLKSKYRIL